jgi:hypothetical protein
MKSDLSYKIISSYYDWENLDIAEIRAWLYNNIGIPNKDWAIDFFNGTITVQFLTEQNATLFALRWT